MGFFRSLKRTFHKVGKFAEKVGKKVYHTAETVANKVGDKIDKIGNAGVNTITNASNLLSPGNLLLYAGVGIVAIVMLPKILDTQAARTVAERA